MKHIRILFVLLLFSSKAFSKDQLPTILQSEIDQTAIGNLASSFKPILCSDSSYLYVLLIQDDQMTQGKYVRLEHYDAHLKLLKRSRLNLTDSNGERLFSSIFSFQNKVYVLSTFKNRKTDKLYLFAQTLNEDSLVLNDDIRMIAAFDHHSKFKRIFLKTECHFSNNGTKLLIAAFPKIDFAYASIRSAKFQNKPKEVLHICAFDSNLKLLRQENPSHVQFDARTFVFDQCSIDDSVNMYITGKAFASDMQAKKSLKYGYGDLFWLFSGSALHYYLQPHNYINGILYFGRDGQTSSWLLQTPSFFAKSFTFEPMGDRLFCAGVYSSSSSFSAEGVFSCFLNTKNGETVGIKSLPFPKSYSKPQFQVDELRWFRRKTSRSESDPFSYKLSKLERFSDGNFLFVAERQKWGFGEVRKYNYQALYSIFHYGNLFAVDLSTNGDIKSCTEIEKNQFGYRYSSISYGSLLKDDKLHLLFTDFNEPESMETPTPVKTSLVTLDRAGKIENFTLAEYKSEFKLDLLLHTDGLLPLVDQKAFVYPLTNYYLSRKALQRVSTNP